MKVTKITSLVYTFLCPACNKGEFNVTHLIDKPSNYGSWYCDSCGQAVKFTIQKDGSIDAKIVEGEMHEDVLILLKIPPQKKDIFFVVKGADYKNERWTNEQLKYLYEEHHCPTNFTKNIKTIIVEKDTDPHGLFEYVCAVPKPNISEDDFINLDYDSFNDILLNALEPTNE